MTSAAFVTSPEWTSPRDVLARTGAFATLVVASALFGGFSSSAGQEAVDLGQQIIADFSASSRSVVMDKAFARVVVSGASETTDGNRAALMGLRRSTGLSWDQLARLFGVGRRSVHHWASGRPMSLAHEELLYRLNAVIQRVEGLGASETRRLLLAPAANGSIPFALMEEGRLSEAAELMRSAFTRRETVQHPPRAAAPSVKPGPPASMITDPRSLPYDEPATARAVKVRRVAAQ